MPTPRKQTNPADLSEYAEEAVSFDVVMRRLLKAKPTHRTAKPKTEKPTPKRK